MDDFDKPICKHRVRKKNARRDSGGVCIFLKSRISKGITVVDWNDFEDGIVLKLEKDYFNFAQDITFYVHILDQQIRLEMLQTQV